MLVMEENERLYPATWSYNAARVLTKLAEIIVNNGGRVKPLKNAIISNRTVDSAKKEYKEKIERFTELEKASHNEARAAVIASYAEKLEALEKVSNDPITVTHTSYITFVYDGFYYYYQVNDNPFFEFYYQKTPVKNGWRSRDIYMAEDKKEWLFDCFFHYDCNNTNVVKAANFIFDMLVQAKPSEIYRNKQRKRVANTLNDSWHWETVYSSERLEKIDF